MSSKSTTPTPSISESHDGVEKEHHFKTTDRAVNSDETSSVSESNNSIEKSHEFKAADKKALEADEAQREPEVEWQPTTHEKIIIYTMAVTSLIVALDASIIITPLSTIIQSLGGTATEAFWIGTSYLLVNAVTMPVICAVSNVFGRPICLIFSLVAFTVGTIICATSYNVTQMLVGRSIQGVGGGGIHSLGLVVQTDIVPLRYRPKWYGVTLGSWALGLAIGPVIGGAVVHGTTWRWIFYLMFPILAFGLVAVPYLLTLKPKKASVREKLGRIDWIGSFFFTASATSFLIAISWGGSEFSWKSYQTLVPLIIGFVGLVSTLTYERLFPKEPFLKHSLYHNTSSIAVYVAGMMQGLVMYGLLYYGPFYFLSVKQFSPLNTGLSMLPASLTVSVGGIVAGRLVTRFNNYRWFMLIGWLIAAIGAGTFLVWPHNNSAPVWAVTYVVTGIGQGLVLNAQNFASQANCLPGDEAAAAAMYAFARQFGMALGVGIGGTAFQNVMTLKLEWLGLPTSIAKDAEGYIAEIPTLPEGEFRSRVFEAYNYGFTGVFAFYAGVSVVALVICVLFVKNYDMVRRHESEHTLEAKTWGKSTGSASGSAAPE